MSTNTTGLLSRLKVWQIDAAALCLLIILGALCYALLARPALARRAATRSHAAELASKRDELARLRSSRKDTEQRLESVRTDAADQSVRLEPRSRVNQRLALFTDLAAECGVQVEHLSPGARADGPRHGTVILRFSGRAPYLACERFIARLHDQFNDTALTGMRLASAPGSTDPVSLELELLWFTAPDLKAEAR